MNHREDFVHSGILKDAATPTHSSWNFVAFYKGNITDPRLDAIWTSQVGQDQTVVDVFAGKSEGYFVDLASNDAVSLSNTLTLERQFGWKGLCIEANPHYMRGYLHRTCQLVQAVAGPRENEAVSFKFSNGVFGGVVGDVFDNKAGTESISMHTVSLAKILRDFEAPHVIDYLSLDIEGAEAWTLQTFPWDMYTFLTLTVERPKPELIDMLKKSGYMYLCDHGDFGDQFWVHPELPNFERVLAKYGGKKECRTS
jgi:hypothetical protein